ncbi:MAG: response regulator [Pseudomonadales bacterium]|jgi:DNA-binding response OmpR family regulator|nr:response regulator [Pseudomonadales bacterium]
MSDARPLVWVICDSPLLSPLLLAACEEAGGAGSVVGDAELALSRLKQGGQPALIVVELMLGRETGFRTVRRLREGCTCPVVILNGTERASDAALGLSAGAQRVLSYPLRAEPLRELLQTQAANSTEPER